ncbi:MAG: response regulator [Burkholderiales bacterium]
MSSSDSPTVLVADDNADTVIVVSQTLAMSGYEVVTASSVRQALDLLDERSDIGVVVSDIRMPEEDGFDFLRVLRVRFPSMPMILMTGNAITAEDVVPAGATILQKPFDIGELERLISDSIAQSRH